jgi:formylglycine-generating enzyme
LWPSGLDPREATAEGGIISIRASSSALLFDKVLRAFETGGFTYVDFRSQLKQILAKGASPTELIETLRRRERIEPLPAYAHDEVLRLLNDAAEQAKSDAQNSDVSVGESPEESAASDGATLPGDRNESSRAGGPPPANSDNVRALQEQIVRQNADYETLARAYERSKDVQTAASERVTALAGALATATRSLETEQNKTREYAKALAERSVSAEAHQSRGEELQRKAKDYDTELHAVRESLAAREAELYEIRRQHDKLKSELSERDKSAPQVLSELQSARAATNALTADLADARARLESEREKAATLSKSQAGQAAEFEGLRTRLQDALRLYERHEAEVRTLRITLVDRDVKLAALQQEQATGAVVQETRAKTGMQMQADLAAARARADALLLDLNSSRGTAASLDAQLKRTKYELDAARNELASVTAQAHSYFDLLRTREWRRASEHSAADEAADDRGVTGPSDETLRVLNHELQTRLATTKAQLEQRDEFIAQLRAMRREFRASVAPSISGEPTDVEIDLQTDGLLESQAELAEQPLPAMQPFPSQQSLPSMQAIPRPAIVVESLSARAPAAPRNPFPAARALSWFLVALIFAATIWFFAQYGAGRQPVAAGLEAGAVAGSVIHDCPTCPAMTILAGGRFKQGGTATDGSGPFDKPVHWVAIAHALAMSTNPVTLDEFRAFAAATGRDMQGCDTYDGVWKHVPTASWQSPGFAQTGAHPVTCASWNDAQAYASWVSSKAGHPYRLPSASEWEYAARSGAEAATPWGAAAADACANANVADQSAAQQYPGWSVFGCSDGWVYTAPVGSFKANAFGLNDMLGNVFQWTQDCWNADYTGAPVDGSARADGNCTERELRGGSWFSNPAFVRSSYRNHFAADYRSSSVGIRLVREIE